jgi:hypothetical protein
MDVRTPGWRFSLAVWALCALPLAAGGPTAVESLPPVICLFQPVPDKNSQHPLVPTAPDLRERVVQGVESLPPVICLFQPVPDKNSQHPLVPTAPEPREREVQGVESLPPVICLFQPVPHERPQHPSAPARAEERELAIGTPGGDSVAIQNKLLHRQTEPIRRMPQSDANQIVDHLESSAFRNADSGASVKTGLVTQTSEAGHAEPPPQADPPVINRQIAATAANETMTRETLSGPPEHRAAVENRVAEAKAERDRILLLSKRNLLGRDTQRNRISAERADRTDIVLRHEPTNPAKPPAIPESVQRHAKQLLEQAISLANRGAVYSARAQLIVSLRLVAQALDAESQSSQYSEALSQGLKALDEAANFAPAGAQLEADLDIRQIIETHSTPVLHGTSEQPPTPLRALQAYHAFAEERMAVACGCEAVASEVLMVLAKIQPRLIAHDRDAASLAGPRAMSMYQAALIVDPNNYLAANELAVLFATFGQLEDARDLLTHCIRLDPANPVGWKNLSEVHQRIGEPELARAALEEWRLACQQQELDTGPRQPAVEWVEPSMFSFRDPIRPIPYRASVSNPAVARAGNGRTKQSWLPWMPAEPRLTSAWFKSKKDESRPTR